MVSFANKTKTEICGNVNTKSRQYAFLYGALLTARQLYTNRIVLQTECEAFANLLTAALHTVCPKALFDTEFRTRANRLPQWIFSCEDKSMIAAMLRTFQIDIAKRDADFSLLKPDDYPFFLAGIFVTGGSVSDPSKDYHLEVALPTENLCSMVSLLLAEKGIAAKTTTRKQDFILYLKQNEQISDALTYFSAQNAALEFVEAQVYKSFRSQTNRRTNCDLANIEKTIAAGESQIADIQLIADTVGLADLPENLRTIAAIRLESPEATLRDLGAMLDPPISRSGVHHRLQKLAAIAEEIRAKQPDNHENGAAR